MAKQHKYERLKDFRLGSVFGRLFGEAAGTASGKTHKRIRSTFDGCYSAESVAQTVKMMEQECKQFLQQIVREKKVFLI
jgi:lauroyl/myristoyl acyltransferase